MEVTQIYSRMIREKKVIRIGIALEKVHLETPATFNKTNNLAVIFKEMIYFLSFGLHFF